ncbi:MAG: sulfur carrier protein ThiS [Candidatus Hydrogenedentes bacterium]|nr:sulfur carrier protein ThiS [Candidatus Hydrogenedentota bacterium]
MTIVVNGESKSIRSGTSAKVLIVSLGLLPEATAVQRNDEIVPRAAYGTTMLEEGDVIELVRFVGGG